MLEKILSHIPPECPKFEINSPSDWLNYLVYPIRGCVTFRYNVHNTCFLEILEKRSKNVFQVRMAGTMDPGHPAISKMKIGKANRISS